VVKNSDALVYYTTIQRGHVLAMYCQEGANIQADSLIIRDNITGIACDDKALLKLNNGAILKNRHGIAIRKGSSVSIVAADITKNRIAIMESIISVVITS